MNRRGFLGSILALAVAPAIVRADSLMRVIPRATSIFTGELVQIEGMVIYESSSAITNFAELTAEQKRAWAKRVWTEARQSPLLKFFVDGDGCYTGIVTPDRADSLITPAPQALITQGARHV